MSPQKDNRITKWAQEQHMEKEDNQWILENPTTILKIGSRNASTATNTDIWQRNAEQRRRNERHKCVSNVTKRGISPRTVKEKR